MYCLGGRHTEVFRRATALALLLGVALLGICSRFSSVASESKFTEEDTADFIARYYSDETSYVLKPLMREGSFQSIYDRSALLKLARQQSGRELAVIVLVHYPNGASEEPVKLGWVNDLTGLGYRRVVFLRSRHGMSVKGLRVLEGPRAPTRFAGK